MRCHQLLWVGADAWPKRILRCMLIGVLLVPVQMVLAHQPAKLQPPAHSRLQQTQLKVLTVARMIWLSWLMTLS